MTTTTISGVDLNSNKRAVIMDEAKRLVKTTSPPKFREMFDGFDTQVEATRGMESVTNRIK